MNLGLTQKQPKNKTKIKNRLNTQKTQMRSQVNQKRKRKEEKEKKRRREKEKRKAKSLDESIMKQVRKTRRQVFFTELTMQNIEEFCFLSIVKRGHLFLPNFLPVFLINFQKKQKIAKNIENSKKCFFDIFASFLAFSASS